MLVCESNIGKMYICIYLSTDIYKNAAQGRDNILKLTIFSIVALRRQYYQIFHAV